MVKSAGSDRSGTYGTCRGGRSSLLGGKRKEQEKERQKREEQMLRDYPEIVSKMVLLLGAGLGMRKVLERIAVDYRKNLALGGQKRFAYEEIVFTCQEMENGVSEQEAYQRMGMRMGTGAYRSLAVLLTQNLKKAVKDCWNY